MRFHPTAMCLLAVFVASCDSTTPTEADGTIGLDPSFGLEAAESACTLALHAILREAGSDAVVGQVQFRIDPPEPGSSDATVEYRGVYGPTGGLTYGVLETAIVSRIPDQAPTWSDVEKSAPGTTLLSVVHFGRAASMSQAMALELVEGASQFKAVVNVVGVTGGAEAEGLMEPRRDVPESLRDRQRVCFGGG